MNNYIASVVVNFVDKFSNPALKAKAAWADLKTGAEKAQAAGAKMVSVGQKATFAVSAPLVAIGAKTLQAGVDFNKGLANVASLGVAEARVRSLGKNVQTMAVEFGQSTSSLNEGLYNVISAFGDSADTSKILEINTKAAAAGMATTSEAIALTSAVTKGYGDTSEQAMQKAADLAFQTVKLGQTTFPELASSIGKVTGNANALGVSQEDLFAVFATTTGVVGTAAEVSTSTSAVLTEMIKPGKELAGAISALGYSSSDAMIAQLGFGGAIQALGGYAQDSGKKITNLFSSSEAGKVAMAVAGSQAGNFNSKLKEMKQSAGALDAAYDAQAGGINALGHQYNQLKAQVAVSAQNIGQGLMPVLRVVLQVAEPLAQSIGAIATGFSALPQPVQNTVLATLGMAAAAGPLAIAAGKATSGIGKLGRGIVKARGFISDHKAQIKAIGGGFVSAGGKALAFGKKIGVLGLKGAGHLGKLGLKAGRVGWRISQALGGKYTTGALKFLGTKAFAAGKAMAGIGKKAVVSAWKVSAAFGGKIASPLKIAGKAVAGFGKKAVFAFAKAAVGAWSLAAAHIAAFWPIYAVAGAIAAVVAVGVLLYKNWEAVKAFGATVWSGFVAGVKVVWGWLSKVLDNPLIATASVVFAPFIAVPALIVKHWGKIREFFSKLFGGIAEGWGKFKGLFSWLPGMGKKSGQALGETFAGGVEQGKPKVARAAYGVAYAADEYFPHSNAKKGPLSRLSQSGEALVDTVQKGAEKRSMTLEKALPALGPSGSSQALAAGQALGARGATPARGADGVNSSNYTIHIQNLTVQASDIKNALEFVRMLQDASGAYAALQ